MRIPDESFSRKAPCTLNINLRFYSLYIVNVMPHDNVHVHSVCKKHRLEIKCHRL